MTRTGLVGEGTEEVGIAIRDDEVVRRRQRHRIDAPQLLATDQLADEVVHDVGDERARDPGLDVALGAVVEQGLGGGDGRRRVGQVVGEHLMHVGTAGRRQLADRGADRLVGELDDVRGGGEVGRGGRWRHAGELTSVVTGERRRANLGPMAAEMEAWRYACSAVPTSAHRSRS